MAFKAKRLTSVLGFVLGALMISESAFALRCARPDVSRSYKIAENSPKTYKILVGTFVSAEAKDPAHKSKSHHAGAPSRGKPVLTPTFFEGISLSKEGQNNQSLSNYAVDIETSCIGAWCSNLPDPSQEMIAFVETEPEGTPILRISACPVFSFKADDEKIQKLRQLF